MRVWLPYLESGSGTDVFTARLARALESRGHEAVVQGFPKVWQYAPWRLKPAPAPDGAAVTIANLNVAFALVRPGTRLVSVEHHCVLDPAYAPYRSPAQAVYHRALIGNFDRWGLRASDAVVAVSRYTARSLAAALGVPEPRTILNGIETDEFTPDPAAKAPLDGRPFRLLFVGNTIRRKGADLLPRILARLGEGYEVRYTAGLRTRHAGVGTPGMVPLGRLSHDQLRQEYRAADMLLFPSRFEGFGYAAAEAMACGTPVVTSDCSALPEVVEDRVTGRLCPVDDVDAFAAAIAETAADPEALRRMGAAARQAAVERFSLEAMAAAYDDLCRGLAGEAAA